jgi:uncharacterized protein YegL
MAMLVKFAMQCHPKMAFFEPCLAVVSFNSEIKLVVPFTQARQFEAPVLQAEDYTHMGEAIEYGWQIASEKISEYRNNPTPCYHPIIFMITDGTPQYGNKSEDRVKARQKALEVSILIKELDSKSRLTFFSIGMESTDYSFLQRITPSSRKNERFERLKRIGNTDFKELFTWITVTAGRFTNSIAQPDSNFINPDL